MKAEVMGFPLKEQNLKRLSESFESLGIQKLV